MCIFETELITYLGLTGFYKADEVIEQFSKKDQDENPGQNPYLRLERDMKTYILIKGIQRFPTVN